MRKALLIGFLALAAASPVRAWDETGHKVVAYIAWQQMTPEARENLIEELRLAPARSGLLSLYPPMGYPSRDVLFFMRAGVWPDIVRDRDFPERNELYHRGNWHYTNIFWEQGSDGNPVERADLKPEDVNVVERLSYLRGVASNDFFARAQRAVAVAWLAHLVGDLHQPLHASARVTETEPEGDRGGNLFRLEERHTLHGYWDRLISAAYPRTENESELAHVQRIGRRIMERYPASEFASDLHESDYEQWARDSYEIATEEVYRGLERGETPPSEYAKRTIPIAERRVALAGYRLGEMMNQIFD